MGVVNINDIKRKKQEEKNMELLGTKALKKRGYAEIRQYEELVDKFLKDIGSLTVFKDLFDEIMADQIQFILKDIFLNALVEPILQGDSYNMVEDILTEEDYEYFKNKIYKRLAVAFLLSNDDDDELF